MLDQTGLMASTRDVGLSTHPTTVRIALRVDEAITWLLSDCVGRIRLVTAPSNLSVFRFLCLNS
ncbi:MAG: hypothetical protein AAGU17_03135 [Anaerolineaceae bacterium]